MSRVYLYKLSDPRNLPFCYVGCTSSPLTRHATHSRAASAGKTRLTHWLKGLKEHGLKPIMNILDECSEREAVQAEQDVISAIRAIRGEYWCLNAKKTSPYRGANRGVNPLIRRSERSVGAPARARVSA